MKGKRLLLFDKRVRVSTRIFILLFAFSGLWNAEAAMQYHNGLSVVATIVAALFFLSTIHDAHKEQRAYDRRAPVVISNDAAGAWPTGEQKQEDQQ